GPDRPPQPRQAALPARRRAARRVPAPALRDAPRRCWAPRSSPSHPSQPPSHHQLLLPGQQAGQLQVVSLQSSEQTIERNNADTFIGFLRTLDTTVPATTDIHLVMDTGSSHVAKKTKAWLATHPRFHVHHTPKHTSWLNQVELFSRL